MTALLIVAGKEIREGLRNRWVLAATLLLASLALALTFLGSAPTGTVGTHPLDVVIVSLSSLSIFLLPLIALLISHDAIVGEIERGTMLLLLSYPVARWQVVLGKFAGHVAILTFATALGYGAAAVALVLGGHWASAASWTAFLAMMGSSVLLGAAFLAIGYLVSALARDRGTAAGAAIGIWLALVLIYDMALLGVLVADQGRVLTSSMVEALLLLNPTDTYRLFNLGGSDGIRALSGISAAAQGSALGPISLLSALAAWTLMPLLFATLAFSRRQV